MSGGLVLAGGHEDPDTGDVLVAVEDLPDLEALGGQVLGGVARGAGSGAGAPVSFTIREV